ncbi:LysR family transcriptional regulator [Pseudocitrobacter faecalis]
MDLKRLRYFCRVVEQGSISQAAKVLNMAQPPLSKRIQELEDELQTPLFTRRGNRIEPTEAGFFLYRKACEILRQVEDTARETMEIAQKDHPQFRLGLTHLFQSYFKPLLLALYERNPNIEVNISVTDSSHLEMLLNEGAIDLALIQRPYRSEGFDFVSFDPIKLVAVISKNVCPRHPRTLSTTRRWLTFRWYCCIGRKIPALTRCLSICSGRRGKPECDYAYHPAGHDPRLARIGAVCRHAATLIGSGLDALIPLPRG